MIRNGGEPPGEVGGGRAYGAGGEDAAGEGDVGDGDEVAGEVSVLDKVRVDD